MMNRALQLISKLYPITEQLTRHKYRTFLSIPKAPTVEGDGENITATSCHTTTTAMETLQDRYRLLYNRLCRLCGYTRVYYPVIDKKSSNGKILLYWGTGGGKRYIC